jgi:hypothetical protein
MAERITRCRILGKQGNQCTAEAVIPDGEILLCTKHLGQALRLFAEARTATAASAAAAKRAAA